MKKEFYIYYPQTDSYGIMVIINQLIKICKLRGISCTYICNLDNRSKEDVIIPVLTEPAIQLAWKGFNPNMIILIDAYTLGELNKIKFYFSKGLILKYDFLYSCYAYIKNIIQELFVLHLYKHAVLVSETDIDYLKKLSSKKTRFVCVPNGVFLNGVSQKTQSETLRFGILSSWTNRVSYEENDWFISSFYRKYIRTHKNVELHIAGRGKYLNRYHNSKQIRCIGEVENLDDFFKNIDIFLVVNPKGCGILNRVLDAFSYKTIVLGHEKSFSGFRYMNDCFITFQDYTSFVNGVEFIKNRKDEVQNMINNAYEQIIHNNNWDANYKKLVDYMNDNL